MSKTPGWLNEGWPHIWLPYAQMKTAPQPLPVVGARGARLKLADGRELKDVPVFNAEEVELPDEFTGVSIKDVRLHAA